MKKLLLLICLTMALASCGDYATGGSLSAPVTYVYAGYSSINPVYNIRSKYVYEGYSSINPVYNINGKYIYAGYSSINPVYNFVTR